MKLYNSCQGIEKVEGKFIIPVPSFKDIMINYNKLDHTVWKIFEKKIKKFSLRS